MKNALTNNAIEKRILSSRTSDTTNFCGTHSPTHHMKAISINFWPIHVDFNDMKCAQTVKFNYANQV